MKRVRIFIWGDVQGKYFRAAIQEKAVMMDITGYVRNKDDGSVMAVLEGDEADIDDVIDFCKEGPRGAAVDDVDVVDENYEGDYEDFEIRL
ncbi:MAG: acylphosphatase [Nanoarchaeota archaeon]|nr:acylphosphatase [Nanoarchaeota archaeon]